MLQLDLLSLSTHPNKATELKTSITWLFSTITSNHVSIVSINGKSNVKSNVLSGCTYPTKEISKRKVKRHRDNSAEFACFGKKNGECAISGGVEGVLPTEDKTSK